MRQVLIAVLLATPGVLASCGRKDQAEPVTRPHVMMFVPKLPGSIVVDTTGAVDAERLTMVVSVSGDSVANFYRTQLRAIGWRLRGDNRTSATLTDLYAEGPQGGTRGPTLWVHIEHQDPRSARYTLISSFQAAVRRDTTRTAPPRN